MLAHELLGEMMALGMRLIPLEKGGKVTFEKGWHDKPGERNIVALKMRMALYYGLTADQIDTEFDKKATAFGLNVGIHNDSSRVLILDADDPQAIDTLLLGLRHVGVKTPSAARAILNTGVAWQSPRGVKRMWRLPRGTPDSLRRSSAVVRRIKDQPPQTVVELRTTMQDALPPSYRADAKQRLKWLQPLPPTLPILPAELAELHALILARDPALMIEVHKLIGSDPDLGGQTAASLRDYPSAYKGHDKYRRWVNAHMTVEQLLDAHPDYSIHGARYRYDPSSGSASIAPPRANSRESYWQCWDSNCPVYGQFDAWRALVDACNGGDIALTAQQISEHMPSKIDAKSVEKAISLDTYGAPVKGKPGKTPTPDIERDLPPLLGVEFDNDIEPPPPLPRLLDGGITIAKGLTILLGKPKQGKSYTAIGLALAAAIPKFEYADTRATGKPARVLVIGPDMSMAQYQRLIHDIKGRDYQVPKNALHIIAGRRAITEQFYPRVDPSYEANEDFIGAIGDYVRRYKIDLVIIDVLANLQMMHASARPANEMAAQYALTADLRDMIAEADIYCIAIHWSRKNSRSAIDWGNSGEESAGMNSLTGGTDHAILVGVLEGSSFQDEPGEDGQYTNVAIGMASSGRDKGTNWARVFEVDRNTGTMSHLPGMTPATYAQSARYNAIVSYIANAQFDPARPNDPVPIPGDVIAAAMSTNERGWAATTIKNRVLVDMAARRVLLVHRGRGKENGYTVPDDKAQAYRANS